MNATAHRAPVRPLHRLLAVAGFLAAAALLAPAGAAAQFGGTDGQLFSDPEITSYRLTSSALTRFVQATEALKELENIELGDDLDMDDPESMDVATLAAAFDREPRVRAAIAGAGMNTREYVTFMLAMIQTVFASVMVQMGGEGAIDDMPAGVLKDNIRFFLDNQEAFEALEG